MKNIWFSIAFLLVAMPVLASNCVSRVDKNLNKTTAEKVTYCLEEDQTPAADEEKSEVIWSDTYTVQYPAKKPKAAPADTVNNPQDKPAVRMGYIDRKDYPVFRNDTWPSLSKDEAHEAAMEVLQNDQAAAKKTNKKQKPAKKTKKSAKPSRNMKKQPSAPATAAASTPATPAASAQVQQAEALQNDPLATNPTDNGTVPNDFLDDSVMGPAGFGYNDTDPAFQQ